MVVRGVMQNIETFLGFPWVLRLRYLMENAYNVSQARSIFENTNNTVGFNHMASSEYDAMNNKGSPAAIAFETMAGYTAYFYDNDPREANATFFDASTNQTIPIGFPLKEALWRTNNGYDPLIRDHYQWKTYHAGRWSLERYMFAAAAFRRYAAENVLIDVVQAVNISSILGDKGSTAYHCPVC
jgi:hypothetical protein